MIDLHCHTLFSDGDLLPSELIQRAQALGHRGLALTDHADQSNLVFILENLLPAVKELNRVNRIQVLVGVELTHLPPEHIAGQVARARALGAQIVIVHGETLTEPVPAGTNRAAIEAKADILAHPGLLTLDDAHLAARNGVLLEISARRGHSLSNGLVASLARQSGAGLVFNTDTHSPSDLVIQEKANRIGLGAGLSSAEVAAMFDNSYRLWQQRCALHHGKS